MGVEVEVKVVGGRRREGDNSGNGIGVKNSMLNMGLWKFFLKCPSLPTL